MYIEKVIISNFRIYYGADTVEFAPNGAKNITVISGGNGRGKTTFLTALVWCLYGNQMRDVDKFYAERIFAAGGYKKYLLESMNTHAKLEGNDEFSVLIRFKEVDLPGIQCNSIELTRTFNINNEHESLQLKIDDSYSELVEEVGKQVFIQDFILPKEIAKFFFFDAERIVELAEISSNQEKRNLSQAYSEVLGINKYEELKSNLQRMRIRFRRDSASAEERTEFDALGKEIRDLESSVEKQGKQKERLMGKKTELWRKSNQTQERLFREGSFLSIDEIEDLRKEKLILSEREKELSTEFKELLEYAPFAMLGKILLDVRKRLDAEEHMRSSGIEKRSIKGKIEKTVHDLNVDVRSISLWASDEQKHYFISRIEELLNKHFIDGNEDQKTRKVKILHDFTSQQKNDFDTLYSHLKTSYRNRLNQLSKSLKNIRLDYSNLNRKVAYAESGEANTLISNYRLEKGKLEEKTRDIDDVVSMISQTIGRLENEIRSKTALYEELANKIKVNEKYKYKDQLATRLISELNDFTRNFREEKKISLETRILTNINVLMQKKGFIHKVVIDVMKDMIEIRFFDGRSNEIRKDDLSKGEQQLYATALLKALVEESGMEFPVFIDSPLQKFDDTHTRNIINTFYPNIAKQVVLFPLTSKEFGEEEYELLFNNVESIYTLGDYSKDASIIEKVDPSIWFSMKKHRYRAAEYA
ncbi:DNA sulfur modification protein DndD [Chloroflexota bacterium]